MFNRIRFILLLFVLVLSPQGLTQTNPSSPTIDESFNRLIETDPYAGTGEAEFRTAIQGLEKKSDAERAALAKRAVDALLSGRGNTTRLYAIWRDTWLANSGTLETVIDGLVNAKDKDRFIHIRDFTANFGYQLMSLETPLFSHWGQRPTPKDSVLRNTIKKKVPTIQKMIETRDPDMNRVGFALASALGKDGEVLLPSIIDRVAAWTDAKGSEAEVNAGLAAYESIRSEMSQETFEKEVKQRLFDVLATKAKQGPKLDCESICNQLDILWDNAFVNTKAVQNIEEPARRYIEYQYKSRNISRHALTALLLARTVDTCPKSKDRLRQIAKGFFPIPKPNCTEACTPDPSDPLGIRQFVDEVSMVVENLKVRNSFSLYGMTFTLHFFDEILALGEDVTGISRDTVIKARESLAAAANEDLDQFVKLTDIVTKTDQDPIVGVPGVLSAPKSIQDLPKEQGTPIMRQVMYDLEESKDGVMWSNSAHQMHVVAALQLSLGNSNQAIAGRFRDLRKKSKELGIKSVPYFPTTIAEHFLANPNSTIDERSGAARGVLYYLSLWMEGGKKADQTSADLKAGLNLFSSAALELAFHEMGRTVHAGPYGFASYYLTSTMPYALLAIDRLEAAGQMKSAEAKQYRDQLQTVHELSLGMNRARTKAGDDDENAVYMDGFGGLRALSTSALLACGGNKLKGSHVFSSPK